MLNYGILIIGEDMKTILKVIIVALVLPLLFFLREEKEPELSKEEKLLNEMTIEEKIGQMFIVRNPLEDNIEKITKYHLGGYILFARDFENKTKEDFKAEIKSYQDVAKTPLFIAVDEEGGKVVRASKYKEFRDEPFKSAQELYKDGGIDKIVEDAKEKSQFLKDLGININFAPVADISENSTDYIYPRTLGENEVVTSNYISKVVNVMNEEKIGSVLKHFPGYGSNVDTHTGIAIDNRKLDEFRKKDFLPFIAGIKSNASMIMVNHNIISDIDKTKPASLSKNIHNIIRDELKFNGVIITDDLYMDAIKNYADEEKTAIMAIEAGNDVICCTDFEVQIPAVIDYVKKGLIKEERINESVLKILKLKVNLGII